MNDRGEIFLKALLRILVLMALILLGFYFITHTGDENEPLKGPTKTLPNPETPQIASDVLNRPTEGWSTYVGEKITKIEKKLGKPIRKGPSAYGFNWWVYNENDEYILVGEEKGKINQLFLSGKNIDLTPFRLGQTIEELYSNTITDTEVNVTIDDNVYTMILNEEDLQSRLLVMYDGVLAQLYFDQTTNKLIAIRFIEGEALVKQKPYDMTYVGEVLEPKKPSSFEQQKIDVENALQLFELSNTFRELNDLSEFKVSPELDAVTQQQLQGIIMEPVSKENIAETELKALLKNNSIPFDNAAENLAEEYSDAPEAISGFVNSEKHRKDLFNPDYNYLGTGAFETNFAQIFVEDNSEQ